MESMHQRVDDTPQALSGAYVATYRNVHQRIGVAVRGHDGLPYGTRDTCPRGVR